MTKKEAYEIRACMMCGEPGSTVFRRLSNGNRVMYCRQCSMLEPVVTSFVGSELWDIEKAPREMNRRG